ncbi:hypothetical protein [Aestuariibaculum lutulentum]|uniref:Pentapeptide repeat-containing protein n=1 Tax=Aestuariibaculum lutulentum TaxID=2920935 RepID=A0ABS9RGZ2_9FLAO|nr:hypothetical protein [Aestuariibaculum lutulentum]MCH4552209.1 hypothetical protein [Aestuariibaculum lutulentum]
MKFINLIFAGYFLIGQEPNVDIGNQPNEITSFFLYGILFLSIILNIILILLIKKSKRTKPSKNTTENHQEFYKSNYQILTKNNQLLKEKIIALEREIEIHNKKKESNDAQSSKVSITNENQFYEDDVINTYEFKNIKPKSVYLPSPFEEKRFSAEDVSDEIKTSSLYEIILDSSNITGQLTLIKGADFTKALNSPDHYLEKACVFENAFNSNAKGINVIHPGKVKLEDQDWVITEKIKIEYL